MRVLFVTSALPHKTPFNSPERRPPLGLGTLMSITRNSGHEVHFIDNYLKPSNFIEEGFLQKNGIDYVGISANNICYRDTCRMLHKIEDLRERGLWKGKIIVGGPYVTISKNNLPEFVDHIVQGEGEEVITDIIDGKLNERLIKTRRINDLDSLPFEPWDIFAKLPYDYTCPWIDVKPVFSMNTSRGCPGGCAFCSVGSIWGQEYTCFSADRIVAEVEYLVRNFGVKGIYFREDNFVYDKERVFEFSERIIEKGINIRWACEARVDTLKDRDLVKSMGMSGCRGVYLGVESGSQRILDKIHKRISVEEIEETTRICEENDIKTYCSLLVGLPGETYEDYSLTRRMLRKLKPHSHCFNVYVGIPGSPLYRYALDNNLYEYMDDVGLMYFPGFDVKVRFFQGTDSKLLVDHDFKHRTEFDEELLKEMNKSRLRKTLERAISFLPA